ncbi:two component transcriptional regulator, LuxR family [Paenibacillus curdlanolyticus YK9]|uniref:Two component transcriptional regulator, LuxR family n=1 Tax=Paenibacillus curdlanolyticus YK9 TaxID=717606 RepID=E0ICD4_9BACL|nr:response regulator transcription factor [Paenibacillus curdlanolyticus]EFM09820.1 two component transcriptional regulator, LuxR family [Paenibacillus curdlanolyticus YK9]
MKVVIAEDQGMLRGALSALLDLEDDIEVIGQAENGEQALALVLSLSPDICLLDIEMPLLSGLDVAERLFSLKHPCKVVILTTFSRAGYFQRAMRSGVCGFLLKDSPIDELGAALRKVNAGGRAVSAELAVSLWEAGNPLTEREQEVLRYASEGLSAREIAARVHLTAGTVRNYMSESIRKLEAKNRIDAISIATHKGWLT